VANQTGRVESAASALNNHFLHKELHKERSDSDKIILASLLIFRSALHSNIQCGCPLRVFERNLRGLALRIIIISSPRRYHNIIFLTPLQHTRLRCSKRDLPPRSGFRGNMDQPSFDRAECGGDHVPEEVHHTAVAGIFSGSRCCYGQPGERAKRVNLLQAASADTPKIAKKSYIRGETNDIASFTSERKCERAKRGGIKFCALRR